MKAKPSPSQRSRRSSKKSDSSESIDLALAIWCGNLTRSVMLSGVSEETSRSVVMKSRSSLRTTKKAALACCFATQGHSEFFYIGPLKGLPAFLGYS